jgi:hypothetical protein
MGNVISPASLREFRKNLIESKWEGEPRLGLGIANMLYINKGAQLAMKLNADDHQNHLLITQDDEGWLYIKKTPSSNVTWEVKKYKDGGMRITKTALCRFLRTYFKIRKSQTASFKLTPMEDGSFRINVPTLSIVEEKEVSNG